MLNRLRTRAGAVRERADAGISLTELLVAMGLSSIIGALSLGMFLTVNTSTIGTTDRTINAAQARTTLQTWTAYLRVSDGTTAGSTRNRIEWLAPHDMLFYANLDNRSGSVDTTGAPTMVWLRLDSEARLVEEQFPSQATVNTPPTRCRVLAENAGGSALFVALDAQGAQLTGADLGTPPTATSGCQNLPVTVPSQGTAPDPAAVANLQNVASVSIDITIAETRGSRSQQFTSVATLPALGGSA